ncbi:MAG: class I tRNA ligase family protein, partial [Candidatus Magasanikbacteria bacterium]|nr:class I tRNA ligase family protein [Candidatus Magasanikbacteria bacterium]
MLCYNTFSQLLAPIAPFLSEEIYRNLTNEESVHLSIWPQLQEDKINT